MNFVDINLIKSYRIMLLCLCFSIQAFHVIRLNIFMFSVCAVCVHPLHHLLPLLCQYSINHFNFHYPFIHSIILQLLSRISHHHPILLSLFNISLHLLLICIPSHYLKELIILQG